MPITPGPKFNIWLTVQKVLKAFGLFVLPQVGNILGSVQPTEGGILAFVAKIFPALDPTIGMVISSILLGIINGMKHWNDGKTK